MDCWSAPPSGFNAVQNNTSLKLQVRLLLPLQRFNAVQNNTSLKLRWISATMMHRFNAVQNNTSLKPQIQKSDRFFHFKVRILFRITTP